ncbi:MAG: hypothetical protein KC800_33235 [Candidatus Eremiobacteraeota bacterium]|nr:hypothetical protein [Candidatus Eremiobacteraeota bacterium]
MTKREDSLQLQSKVLGPMKQVEFDDWWEGRSVDVPLLGGLTLPVTFLDLNPSSDPSFVDEADAALQKFLAKTLEDRGRISPLVKQNCGDFLDAVGVDDWNLQMAQITQPDDIWDFVHPKAIRINRRRRRDKALYLQIECECDWEEEHGLLLVFREGEHLTRVSDQDGHLTEADAYDKPDDEDDMLWAVLNHPS